MKGYAIVGKKGKIVSGPRDIEKCLCIFKHKTMAQEDLLLDNDEQVSCVVNENDKAVFCIED